MLEHYHKNDIIFLRRGLDIPHSHLLFPTSWLYLTFLSPLSPPGAESRSRSRRARATAGRTWGTTSTTVMSSTRTPPTTSPTWSRTTPSRPLESDLICCRCTPCPRTAWRISPACTASPPWRRWGGRPGPRGTSWPASVSQPCPPPSPPATSRAGRPNLPPLSPQAATSWGETGPLRNNLNRYVYYASSVLHTSAPISYNMSLISDGMLNSKSLISKICCSQFWHCSIFLDPSHKKQEQGGGQSFSTLI